MVSTRNTHTLETAGTTWPATLEGLTHGHHPQLPTSARGLKPMLNARTASPADENISEVRDSQRTVLWTASEPLLTQLIFPAASALSASARSSRGPSGHAAGICGHVRDTKPGAQGKTLDYPAIRVLHVACGSAFAKLGILPGPPTWSHLPEENVRMGKPVLS